MSKRQQEMRKNPPPPQQQMEKNPPTPPQQVERITIEMLELQVKELRDALNQVSRAPRSVVRPVVIEDGPSCDFILTRGSNKGRACGQTKCKHLKEKKKILLTLPEEEGNSSLEIPTATTEQEVAKHVIEPEVNGSSD